MTNREVRGGESSIVFEPCFRSQSYCSWMKKQCNMDEYLVLGCNNESTSLNNWLHVLIRVASWSLA